MIQTDDLKCVARVLLLNDTRAFDCLVKKYQSPIRRFFLHQTGGNEATADDLAQDTFIKAYSNLASFRQLSGFSTWLYRIAYNVFYDYIRSIHPTESLDSLSTEASAESVKQADVGKQMDIYRALAALKPNERLCINLFYLEDQPIEKIATIAGIPAGTVKSHLSRGKEKLATYLKNNGYE